MATPPKPLNFRFDSTDEEIPEWIQPILEQLNVFASQVTQTLGKGVTRGDNLAASDKVDFVFTTQATADNTFPIKVAHGLADNPKHVVCTKLARDDGTAITSAWGMTWENGSGGQVLVRFQGLSGSAKYRVSMTFE